MKYYSYIRKSTSGQIYDRQLRQLTDFAKQDGILPHDYKLDNDLLTDKDGNTIGLKKDNELSKYITLVTESRTGTDQSRPALLKLLETMKYERTKGEVCLLLVECTRLGRSYEGNTQLFLTLKKHDIKFVVTTFPQLLDTRVKNNNPATALVSDIVLAVFNWLSEQEHTTTLERCNAGRQQAKARGVKFGRKNMTAEQLPEEFVKVLKSANGSETVTALLDSVNGKLSRAGKQPISRATFYNYKKIYEESL
jgi:DNA invertase Pin-like site-specific DNA recombinase